MKSTDYRPFISICIPAYKRIDYLKRLLDSVQKQTFHDYEVIVSDDSPDDSVRILCESYESFDLKLTYRKNSPSLGTPGNWNKAISMAKGLWIKLMHDDDWFIDRSALMIFAEAARAEKKAFIFSSYKNVFLDSTKSEIVLPVSFRLRKLKKHHASLFSRNIIGPPSVILHRNDGTVSYDENTKWVVDIDFYMQRLAKEDFFFIQQPLVCVGMGNEQVTVGCVNNPEILVKENFYLLQKIGWHHLTDIWVYDAFWRLIRNLRLKDKKQIAQLGFEDSIPKCISSMISFQSQIPYSFLKNGPFSKFLMAIHFLVTDKRSL